jgi:hypothetical protein
MIRREFKKHLCGKTDWTGTWIVTRLLPVLGKIKKGKKKTDVHLQKEEDSKLATELFVLIKPSVPYSTWKSFHLNVVLVVWGFLRNFIQTCVAKGSTGKH